MADDFALLWEIDKHYARKEHLLFPYMEKYGITAPPKVMWGVDDEIRDAIKETRALLSDYNGNKEQVISKANEAISKAEENDLQRREYIIPNGIGYLKRR